MPSAQVINLNPQQRTEPTTLERTLSGFADRYRQNQVERQDVDALADIYRQHQNDGDNLTATIKAIQTRPGMSPTARVNVINQLNQFQKHNNELIKNSEKQYKNVVKAREEEESRNRAREALKRSGASEAQVALYDVAPVGGQTKIVGDIIDDQQRRRAPPGLNPDIVDYDAGLTPKERVSRQDSRFSLQTPLVTKNSETVSALENEALSLQLLDELTDSGLVGGEGLQRLNINPKTGDLFIPQFATPEEQLFVKTVNDFTVKAKDSFGARVTNFELDRFMQRLPTLANSNEGRKLILRQMKIVNEINQLEKKAIQKVFDQYGVRNIDYVDAENKARKEIEGSKETLRKEYFNLEQLAKKEDAENMNKIKSKVKDGYTAMVKPDGTIKQFPTKNVPNLEEKGYKRL